MPDTKISADSAATTTAGAEVAGIQGGGNVRIPAGLLQQSVRMGTVTATAHGFVAGDVLKLSGTTWSKAIATSVANATAIAVVESVTTDTFVPVLAGRITLSGLTAGIYYLSDATAGLLTLTAPTTTSSYLVPILRAVSSTDAYVDIGSPLTLSAIASTDISDFNSATRAQVEAELVAGTNVTLTPSGTGASRQITIAATGGGGGSGDVTAAAVIADNAIVRGDGGSKGVQGSAPTITDAGDIQVNGDGVQGSLTLADAHATDPKSISITVPATITDPYRLVIPGTIPTAGQFMRVASVTGEVVALEHVTPSVASTGITDSTTAGRALLTAADASAQRTAMGVTASPTTTKGDIIARGASADERIAAPTHYFYNTLLPDFDGAIHWWHVPWGSMAGTNGSSTTTQGWQCLVNGTGSGALANTPNGAVVSGMLFPFTELDTGTTTTGGAKLYWRSYINAGENRAGYRWSQWSVVELETWVSLSALSDGTDTYKYMFGLIPGTTNASTAPTYGCYIELSDTAKVVGRVSSTDTATSTTAISSATAYRLRLRLDVGAGTLQGWLGSTNLGTVSSGLPDLSTNSGMDAASWLLKSAGTTSRTANAMPIFWKMR